MNLIEKLDQQNMKAELPEMNVGDTVRVHVKIKEGSRERIQVFEGTIIAKKHGGVEQTITVRRLSYGVGVEKVFPVHSPNIVNVETVRRGKVRRAKLYYLRDRCWQGCKGQGEDLSFGNPVKEGALRLLFLLLRLGQHCTISSAGLPCTLKQKSKKYWTVMQPFWAAATLYRCPQRSVERDRRRTAS